MHNNDQEIFSNDYVNEEKEILILTNNISAGASRLNNSWISDQHFLAYYDLTLNKLVNGEGRVNWLLTALENKDHSSAYPHFFKKETIYHLRVRQLKENALPEGRLPSFYNRFMVVEVLQEDAENTALQEVLNAFTKPIVISDSELGEFELMKTVGMFEGQIPWLKRAIRAYLTVNVDDKKSWNACLEILRELSKGQKNRDQEFRTFAAEELTSLANDWREGKGKKITRSQFEKRIELAEIVIDYDQGDFTVYFSDDGMFHGHSIRVTGNIKTGLKGASI